ncbi:MAG: glycosyltransferase family 39 protein [Lentimicrobium sp.]|nr:glycosyltransferase family 39 protein [Lentimicrobium sp.]
MNFAKLIRETLNNQQKRFWLLTGLILLVALALRLTGLGFSYSNDELSALLRVRFDSFSQLVDDGFYVDGHPGGIQVFLFYWVKLFGMSEWAVRLPFSITGVLAVYFAIRVFTRWFGPTTGLLTGAFLAFLEFPLLYSQIARPYGAGLFFSMMMTWFWTRLLFDNKPKVILALAYALSATACMYTHYFSFLFTLIAGITGLFFMNRTSLKYYLGAGLAAALLFSPHIYITLNHLSIGGVGLWLAKPENGWLLSHIWYILNESYWISLMTGLIFVISVFFGRKSLTLNKFHLISIIFFLVPFLTGFFYSRMVNPVLQHSVLIFTFPFLLALLFSFSDKIPSRWAGILVIAVLFAGTAQTIAGNRYFSKQHFGEFKGIAKAIVKWNQQYGAENITRAISINNPWYLDFYLDQVKGRRTTFEQYDNRGGAQLDSLAGIINKASTTYFMYAWTKPVPMEINDIIRARFPCVEEHISYEGLAEATLYSKSDQHCLLFSPDTLYKVKFESNISGTEGLLNLDSLEYSPGFEGAPAEILEGKTGIMVATIELFADTIVTGAILAISFHNENGETTHWLGARADLYSLPGQWNKIRQTISLPDQNLINSRMKVYFWNPGKNKIIVRNLSITLEKPLVSTIKF